MCLHYSFSVFLFLPPSVGVLKEVSEAEKGCQEGGRGAAVPGENWDSTPSSYISLTRLFSSLLYRQRELSWSRLEPQRMRRTLSGCWSHTQTAQLCGCSTWPSSCRQLRWTEPELQGRGHWRPSPSGKSVPIKLHWLVSCEN